MDLKILCFLLSSKQNASTFLLIRVLFISKPQCTKKPKCGNRNNGNHWRAWEISKTVRELSSNMGSIVMMYGRYGLHYHDISMHLRGFGLSSSCLWVNKCKRATVRNGLPFRITFPAFYFLFRRSLKASLSSPFLQFNGLPFRIYPSFRFWFFLLGAFSDVGYGSYVHYVHDIYRCQ